ncbi:hypothetical protein CW706_05310 [Candidatus Bathyarchaeota archaeon]|nr:MAG: hypothetical protein CW706_05310 [Candidatus Bathyarchaeota archaeon]
MKIKLTELKRKRKLPSATFLGSSCQILHVHISTFDAEEGIIYAGLFDINFILSLIKNKRKNRLANIQNRNQ